MPPIPVIAASAGTWQSAPRRCPGRRQTPRLHHNANWSTSDCRAAGHRTAAAQKSNDTCPVASRPIPALPSKAGKAVPAAGKAFWELHWLPPPRCPAYAGQRGGKGLRFRVNPTRQSCPPTDASTNRFTLLTWLHGRRRPAASTSQPTNRITPTPGESSGRPAHRKTA